MFLSTIVDMTVINSSDLRIQAQLPDRYKDASEEELGEMILAAKKSLGDQLLILGHHYQRDEVIEYADMRGDSYKLAAYAGENAHAKNIIFCGVHFMAESADVLTEADQHVYLPDLNAGCSMADMADESSVIKAWEKLSSIVGEENIVPITYMNSSAAIKSFVGEHGGAVCTSSNARKILEWALARGKHILFIPDQHLGRNTALEMGYTLDDCMLYDPRMSFALDKAKVTASTFWLWKGHCTTHQRFSVKQIEEFRVEYPQGKVIVHPECPYEAVLAADLAGSTEKIIDYVDAADAGSIIGVGTEIHLVNRLAKENPDKKIMSLDPIFCPCSTMFRVDRAHLAWTIENIVAGTPVNEIRVDDRTREYSRLSLQRMLDITNS